MDRLRIGPVSPLEEKKEAVAVKAIEKQAKLDPARAIEDAYQRALNSRLDQAIGGNSDALAAGLDGYVAGAEELRKVTGRGITRTPGKIADDLVESAAAGTVDFGAGLGALGLEGAAWTFDALDASNIGKRFTGREDQQLETKISSALRKSSQKLLRKGSEISDGIRSNQSVQTQVAREDAQALMAADQAEIEQDYQDHLAQGGLKEYAELSKLGREFYSGAKRTLENPTYLADTVAGQAPSLLAGLGGRAAVSARAAQARAAQIAAAEGTAVTPAIMARATNELATANMMLATGGMEAGGAYQQVAQEIEGTSLGDLAGRFPDVQAQIDAGVSEDEIKRGLIARIGPNAAIQQGLVAAGVSRIAGGFEVDPLNRAGRNVLADMGKEGVEEALQSGSGELAVNTAMLDAGDTETRLLDDVGMAAGEGAAAGVGMAGAIPALGEGVRLAAAAPLATLQVAGPILKATGKAAAKATGAVVQGVGKALESRADAKRAEAEAPARAAKAEATVTTADELRDGLAKSGLTLDMSEALNKMPTSVQEALADTTPEDVDQLGALALVLNHLDQNDNLDPAAQDELLKYTLYADYKLANLARTTTEMLETEQDPEQRAALEQVRDRALALRENDQMVNHRALVSDIEIPTEIVRVAAEIGAENGLAGLTPEMRDATDKVRALVAAGQTKKLSSEQIAQTQALYSEELDEFEKFQFEQGKQLAEIREANETAAAGRKTIKSVGTEMKSAGFELNGKQLRSMSDFASEIAGLAGAGQYKSAGKALEALGVWARHQIQRTEKFDAEALAQIEEFKTTGSWKPRDLPFRQLDVDGQKLDVDSRQYVNLFFEGGHELGKAIVEDATALVDTYNVLREYLPEASRPPMLAKIQEPSWPAAYAATKQTPKTKNTPSPAATTPAPTSEAASEPTTKAESAPAEPQAKAEVQEPAPVVGERAAEEAAPEEEAAAEPTTTVEDVLNEAPAVDFAGPLANDEELTRALELSRDDYLQATGGDRTTDSTASDGLAEELDDREVPSRATQIGEVNGITLHADGNYLYASDGDTVVGLLAVSKAGNEFAVAKDYRGRGIGKAMMRELLLRNPMANSGGMSPAARATRMSVLRELRAERRAPLADSMEARFPGLGKGPGEGELTRNRFLTGFNLNSRSLSIFGQFMAPIAKVREALDSGAAALMKLIPEDARLGMGLPNEDALQGLQSAFGPHLITLAKQLNQTFHGVVEKRIDSLTGEKGQQIWNAADKVTLHVGTSTVLDSGRKLYHYQPRVLEAMSLAGIRWVIDAMNKPVRFDEEAVAKMFPDGAIPDEFLPLFQSQQLIVMDQRSLARDLVQILGLMPNHDASVTSNDALMLALAGDILAGLEATGWVQITRKSAADAYVEEEAALVQAGDTEGAAAVRRRRGELKPGQLTFRAFEFDESHPMKVLSTQLGDTPDWLDSLLTAGAHERAYIGHAPKNQSKTVKGTGMPLGTQQAKMVKVLSNTPFVVNRALDQLLYRFSPQQRLKMFGYVDYDPDNANKGYRKILDGGNQTALLTLKGIHSLRQRTERYAATAKQAREDVKLYWNYRIQSAGRADMQGFGPQSSKWARELYVANQVTMDLANEEHLRDYWLALAQALDVKVEKKRHKASIEEVQAKLIEGGQLAGLLARFRDLVDGSEEMGEAGDTLIAELQAAKFGNPARAFNALLTHAQFERASGSFTHSLAFEVDGKTDGVINALMQFGLSHLGSNLLRQLAQGGLFLGQAERNTLNENPNQGDIYTNRTEAWGEQLVAITQKLPKDLVWQVRHTVRALMRDDVRLVETSTDDKGNPSIKAHRNMFKNPATQKVYGASDYAVIKGMGHAIAESYLSRIHAAVEAGVSLDPALVVEINALAGMEVVTVKDPSGNPVQKLKRVSLGSLTSPEGMKAFSLSPANMRAIVSNLQIGAGAALASQINAELGDIQHNMGRLYQITALQAAAASSTYKRLYAARRAELLAEGKLAPDDALSRNEERKLRKQVEHLLPIFQTSQTEGGGGVLIAENEDSGFLPALDGKKARNFRDGAGKNSVQVTSIGGKFAADINTLNIAPDPGVRVAALFNIAAGDGSMMGRIFQQARAWLNVYDGLEVPTGQLRSASEIVNKAVWDNWMDDMLGNIERAFNQFDFDFNEMSQDERDALIKELRLDREIEESALGYGPASVDLLESIAENARTGLATAAREARAVKQAMSEIHAATDHMAGPEAPHINDGQTFNSPQETLRFLQDRVTELLGYTPLSFEERSENQAAEEVAATAPAEDDNDLSTVDLAPKLPKDAPVSAEGVVLTGKELRALLDKHEFKHKMAGLVYKTIRKLIPDDLRVHRGTPEELRSAQQRLYPDHVVDTSKPGSYVNGTLFLRADLKGLQKESTLVHELVHATTYGIIKAYYEDGGKRLTVAQREAVRNLETLAHHAIAMDETGVHSKALPAFRKFQGILKGLRDAGRTADMVEELMAYTLTSRYVQQAMKTKKGPLTLRVITKRILDSVKKLLGLANTPPVDSFLIQTLGQVARLTTRPIADTAPSQGMLALNSELEEDGQEGVQDRLGSLFLGVERMLMQLPNGPQAAAQRALGANVPYHQLEARLIGSQAVKHLTDAGFNLSEREQAIFSSTHAVFTAMAALDPLAMDELQQVYAQAIRDLESRDLLEDPTTQDSQELSRAVRMLEALKTSTGPDAYGRSPLLSNFISLALVYEPLRKKLDRTFMAKAKVNRDSADQLLRTGAQKIFDLLGEKALKVHNKSQQTVIDEMVNRILHAKKHVASGGLPGMKLMDQIENRVKSGMDRLNVVSQGYAAQLQVTGQNSSNLTKFVRRSGAAVAHGLNILTAPESKGEPLAKAYTMMLNQANMPEFLRNLANEIMGTSDQNRDIHRLLNEAKQRVSQIRQRLREQVPSMLQGFFKGTVSKKRWELLHRTFGQTDLQVLLDSYDMATIAKMLRDESTRQQAIADLRGLLPAATAANLNRKAEALARYIMTKDTTDSELFLARNAEAIVARVMKETQQKIAQPAEVAKIVDLITTLHTLEHLGTDERADTAYLLEDEPEGVEKTLRVLQRLVTEELDKHVTEGHRINAWKGYIPKNADPRHDVVLATHAQGQELMKRGYKFIRVYDGDSADFQKDLGYYATNWSGGMATFNQGALQTVESSLSGIDALTGRTLDPATRTMVTHPDAVDSITNKKMAQLASRKTSTGRGPQMLPVFNPAGDIIAYERPVEPAMLQRFHKSRGHLAEAIGAWMGRQAEEAMAGDLNDRVIEAFHGKWLQDKAEGREKEYVRIDLGKRSAVIKDTWDSVPRQTQDKFRKAFEGQGVMIRKDLIDNGLGYRAPSVSDIFSGTTNLTPETRKALENIAFALAGKHAYTLLVTAERSWQGLIGTAKDIIVVRSGVVAVANLLANQVQLLQMTGWNPARLLKVQMGAARELEHYLRNQTKLTQLNLDLASTTNPDELKRIGLEQQALRDANKRLSIAPLLDAGMLPTIAEGLTEQDQHTLLHDGMRWIEKKAEKLPSGVLTAAKYAIIAKDTALYQGMNRMVQFGDFMAKAALYEALMERQKATRGSDAEWRILDEVNESFVNYNLLPGRGRDYLEGMGVTWFWNYKLRVQKIALRNFKRHPLRFLGLGLGSEMLGLESLLTSSAPMVNWEYSVGPDQLTRAHSMLLWRSMW